MPNNTSIRLVCLLRGNKSDIISCELEIYASGDAPCYEALSYVWGQQEERRQIECNNAKFLVQKNLFSALQALRYEQKSRYLWIDAICIDQSHAEEKSQQIRLMKQIFETASLVVVWLGIATHNTVKAFKLLEKLAALGKSHVIPSKAEPMAIEDLNKLGLPPPSDDSWKAVDAIFWRDWFSRVWVIQEISVSRSAEVVCGPHSIDYWDLIEAANVIYHHSLTTITFADPLLPRSLESFRLSPDLHMRDPLNTLLYKARDRLATNPSDKVYAILGLALDGADLDPNYLLSASTVFARIAKRAIETEHRLDILTYVEDHDCRLPSDLPSWAPDWEVQSPASPLLHVLTDRFAKATLNVPANQCTFSLDGKSLRATGRVIDTVDHMGDTFTEFTPLSGSLAGYRALKSKSKGQDLMVGLSNFNYQLVGRRRWQQWEKIATNLRSNAIRKDEVPSDYIHTIIAGQELSSFACFESATTNRDLQAAYATWTRYWVMAASRLTIAMRFVYEGLSPKDRVLATAFMRAHQTAAYGRRFFTTPNGRMGLCPRRTRLGHKIVLLSGGKTPYILKKLKGGQWSFIGECYVDGLMSGEGWNNKTEEVQFDII